MTQGCEPAFSSMPLNGDTNPAAPANHVGMEPPIHHQAQVKSHEESRGEFPPESHRSTAMKLKRVVCELQQHPGAETATEIVARTATLGSRWSWINWTYALLCTCLHDHAVALYQRLVTA
jgi:hypothetical protein